MTTDGTLKIQNDVDYLYKVIDAPEVSDASINIKLRRITNVPESVISTIQDEYGTSYYYRGAVKNNYVNFNEMCWRIVRIEGDGSVKLLLEDRYVECNDDMSLGIWSDEIKYDFYAYDNSIFQPSTVDTGQW